ncbi:hypothetical protein [Lentibacillus daqui]|uniref:hypothetical protein n=1 Tax=Lentibacillus daqui TaxID=2911514 RepID=UPI0022B0AB86|nr:hypothetical protein [Lentibacillus daqui]
MSKWFYANLLLLLVTVWQVMRHSPFTNIHISVGFIGLLFFLFNWTRQAVFSTIRNTPKRKTKIKLANLSKKIVPFHRWTGTMALIIMIIHAVLAIHRYGFHLQWHKMSVGLVAGLLLIAMVVSGWLRLFWPSVPKRKWHIYIGMTLFVVIFIHILL